jgi:hypothetical protein
MTAVDPVDRASVDPISDPVGPDSNGPDPADLGSDPGDPAAAPGEPVYADPAHPGVFQTEPADSSRPSRTSRALGAVAKALIAMAKRLRALPGWLGDSVAVVGGARRDGLRAIPGSAGRFVGMALTLTFTASVAGLSAAFAMRMALQTVMWAAICLGVFWALLIFNLDRLLMVTLSKNDSRQVKIAGVTSRILVATFVSITIATPITLQIFAKEVDQQLFVQHAEQVSVFQATQKTLTLGKEITNAQNKITQDQDTLKTGKFQNADIEARIQDDESTYDTAEGTCVKDEQKQGEEANGTGGTLTVGAGPVYDAEHQITVRDCGIAAADDNTLKADQADEQTYEQNQNVRLKDDVNSQQSSITGWKASQATQLANYKTTVQQSNGLLARVSALWAIPGWVAHITHIVIALLFFTIELLPILVKSLSLLGPRNHYEKAVDELDDTSLTLLRKRNRHVLDAAEKQRQAQLDTSDEMGRETRAAQVRVFKLRLADWETKAGTAGNGLGASAAQNGREAGH